MEGIQTKCANCDASIEGRVLIALGNSYHPEHFTCENCKLPIKDEKFQQHDGNPFCETCYVKLYSKKCSACKLPIRNKIIKALNTTWHEDCFVCSTCRQPLSGQNFFERDGNPFCEKDYHENFSDKCKECKKPITDLAILAIDAKWHQRCFKCLKCKKLIEENAFQVENGHPVCAKCGA